MNTTHTPDTGNKATATPVSGAPTEFALLRAQAERTLLLALACLRKPEPDWDEVFDFADRATNAIETLRIRAHFSESRREQASGGDAPASL